MPQCSNWRERRLNGWLLMRRVVDYAKEKGLPRVYGDVLAENMTMLQMCAELGVVRPGHRIGHEARCA